MENLQIVRRTRHQGGSNLFSNPILKLEVDKSRFIISKKATENIGLKQDDGIMFGFNFKEKKCFLFQDDEMDSFKVRIKDKNSMRFTSKDLAAYFMDCFQLKLDVSGYYFDVSENPNEKGAYSITKSKLK